MCSVPSQEQNMSDDGHLVLLCLQEMLEDRNIKVPHLQMH
jgi:hypothetical protein